MLAHLDNVNLYQNICIKIRIIVRIKVRIKVCIEIRFKQLLSNHQFESALVSLAKTRTRQHCRQDFATKRFHFEATFFIRITKLSPKLSPKLSLVNSLDASSRNNIQQKHPLSNKAAHSFACIGYFAPAASKVHLFQKDDLLCLIMINFA